MSAAYVLDPNDMVRPRTPRELRAWVETKSAELSQSAEAKVYARRERLPKKLWEEIRPFALFADKRFGSASVVCIPNLGNENFDGRIEFTDGSHSPIYVEITYAKDGYDQSLRMEVLSAEGSVNALGETRVSGTRASGDRRIEVENEAVDHEKVRDNALKLIGDRIHNKSREDYGPNHVLVVVVDDHIAFRTEIDREILTRISQSEFAREARTFGAFYLLGASGEYFLRVRDNI